MTNEVRKLNEALSLHRQGRLPEAAVQYAEVIKRNPRNYQALHFLGVIKATQGLIAEAKDLMQRALSAKPLPAGFVENYATLLAQTEEYDKAISVLEKLPAQTKASETIQYILAVCLYKTGRYGEAADAFERVLAVNPKHLAALNEKGSALAQLERYDEAVECIERALALNPSYADAVQNRAGILQKTGRHDEALLAYEKAIRLGLKPPLLAEAWLGAGIAHAEMGQTTNALSSYQNALKIKPDLIPAWIARGYVLRRLKRYEEALAAYDKALALDPSSAEAWHGRGNALLEQKRYLDAFPALDKAYSLKPDLTAIEGLRLHTKMHLCEWRDFDAERDHLIESVRERKPSVDPFSLLGVSSSTADEVACAALLSERYRRDEKSSQIQQHSFDRRRIRVAYLSADFREHAVARLLAELFEEHDKSRFELFALALCPPDESAIQARMRSAFEHFMFVNEASVNEIVGTIKSLQIDILVDLMGFTAGLAPRVVAARAAPIQVTYLSYPGMSGPCGIDYMLADPTVVPDAELAVFDKAIVRLPYCYLPYDTRSDISGDLPARQRENLPASGFVFCCFNNTFKITPDVFAIWMQILGRVEGSVLWLASTNPTAESNLRKEAANAGVNPDRVRFAPFAQSHADHLARYKLADLFLDTLPFNAHTTACDALWAGTPVLTRIGSSFCGRVAASILRALDLPGLVTGSPEEYRERAIELASSPDRLAAIKDSLRRSRAAGAFFKTADYARHLESAYESMYERKRQGLPADHIDIAP